VFYRGYALVFAVLLCVCDWCAAGVTVGVVWCVWCGWWTYRVTAVGGCLAAAEHGARVLLRTTPGQAGVVGDAAGGDVDRAGGGVVLRAHEAGEGRGGDEEGRVEHAGAGTVRGWQLMMGSAGGRRSVSLCSVCLFAQVMGKADSLWFVCALVLQ